MKKHYYKKLQSLAMLLMLFVTAMPTFAQEDITSLPDLGTTLDGYYLIRSDEDYEKFRQIVAAGNPYANAMLDNNITVSKPIGDGDEQFHYRGTFDGKGFTVKLEDPSNTNNKATEGGLFKNTKPGCVIRNLHVTGYVVPRNATSTHVGSIVDDATGTIIENCISEATMGAKERAGGLVGIARGKCFLNNSAYIGYFYVLNVAGLVGENTQSVSIKSCYVAAHFPFKHSMFVKDPNVFADNVDDVAQNNYYTYDYRTSQFNDIELPQQANATKISDDDVKSGALCYNLNKGGRNGLVWYQHGNRPFPFKGSDGKVITSTDGGNTFQIEMHCDHEYGEGVICSKCGAIQEGQSIDPLQDVVEEGNAVTKVDNIRYTLSSENGEATVVGIGSSKKAVHFPESIVRDGKTYKVVSIKENAFKDDKTMEYCYIPKTVKTIAKDAFAGCSNLKYLHIADGDYSSYPDEMSAVSAGALNIDNEAFAVLPNAINIEKLYVGRNLGYEMAEFGLFCRTPFTPAGSLTEILWGPNVSHVGSVKYQDPERIHLFDSSPSLTKVFFMGNESSLDNNIEITSLSTLAAAKEFYINRNVVSQNFRPDPTNANPQLTGYLYDKCEIAVFGPFVKAIADLSFANIQRETPLESLDFSHAFNLESIGDEAFVLCKKLNYSPMDLSHTKLKSIGEEAFNFCTNIHSIRFGSELKTICSSAFINCENLSVVNIPASVTRIDNGAFRGCKSLSTVVFEDSDTPLELKHFQFAGVNLSYCYVGRELRVNENAFNPSSSCNWVIGHLLNNLDASLFARDNYHSMEFVYSDKPLKFSSDLNCGVNQLTIDRNVMTVRDDNATYTLPFKQEKLGDIKTLNLGANVSTIYEERFKGLTGLKTLVIPSNIQRIDKDAFRGCTNLEVACIFGNPKIRENAFGDCTNLKYVYLMGDQVQLYDNAFANCKNIEEVNTVFTSDPYSFNYSSPIAFDNDTYTKAFLTTANDAHIQFISDPWKKFQENNRIGSIAKTNIYTADEGQGRESNYDRAILPHIFPVNRYDVLCPPFSMDSYYFGSGAEIYSLSLDGQKYRANFTGDYGLGQGYDTEDISFTKVNIDEVKYLEPGKFYIVKVDHEENQIAAYTSLFNHDGVSVNHNRTSCESNTGHSRLIGGDVEHEILTYPKSYVFDEGVIKIHNGGNNGVPTCFQPGSATMRLASSGLNVSVFNLKEEDGETVFMTSKIDVPFEKILEGYATFYSADYNFVAPNWCDVYIVTSADGSYVTLEEISDRTITKGQAVLLKSKNADDGGKFQEGKLWECLTYATHGSTASYEGNLLKGLSEDKTVSDLGHEYVYVLSCNHTGRDVGFYKSNKTLSAGKAYLDPNDFSAEALDKSCLFTFNGIATDIKPAATTDHVQAIYDLMGRRLQEAGYNGIYIINGKKVVKK